MATRRSLASTAGVLAAAALSGCLDTLTGGEGGLEGDSSVSDVQERQREIVTTYEMAVTDRNDGISVRDSGIDSFNAREYDAAVDSLETATERYGSAESGFVDAANVATEIAEEAAASICETSAEETRFRLAAAEAALAAATAARDGEDASTINGHVEEFRARQAEAAELTVEDPDAVAEALGIQ